MAKHVKTIGVLTSGEDAPGMNAAIGSVTRTARRVLFRSGGTILYTARCERFVTKEGQDLGAKLCEKHGIDGLVVIGGDGSFRGGQALARRGINTICVPGTIDLDIACTDYTIGCYTAVNTAM